MTEEDRANFAAEFLPGVRGHGSLEIHPALLDLVEKDENIRILSVVEIAGGYLSVAYTT